MLAENILWTESPDPLPAQRGAAAANTYNEQCPRAQGIRVGPDSVSWFPTGVWGPFTLLRKGGVLLLGWLVVFSKRSPELLFPSHLKSLTILLHYHPPGPPTPHPYGSHSRVLTVALVKNSQGLLSSQDSYDHQWGFQHRHRFYDVERTSVTEIPKPLKTKATPRESQTAPQHRGLQMAAVSLLCQCEPPSLLVKLSCPFTRQVF